jgi:hypothetical protein
MLRSQSISLGDELKRAIEESTVEADRDAKLRDDPERLVGPGEAAKLTGLTEPSLAVYRCTGRLRARSQPHQRVQYRVGDLLAYVSSKYGRRA